MIDSILIYIAQVPLAIAVPAAIVIAIVLSLIGTTIPNSIYTYPELAANNQVVGIKFGFFGEIFAVSLGLALIGTYSFYTDVKATAVSEVSSLRALYYSIEAKDKAAPEVGETAMKQAVLAYTRSIIDDEWRVMVENRMSEKTTSHLVNLFSAFNTYSDESALNGAQLSWLGEIVKARGERTSTNSRSLSVLIWIILGIGAGLSIVVPLFVGSENFVTQALISSLFSAYIVLHLLVIAHLAFPFMGDVAVTASVYIDFVNEISPP